MSGLIAPTTLDAVFGLGLDISIKATLPLAAGLLGSWLPGTAAARHARLALGAAAVPVLAVATLAIRGTDLALAGSPAWPIAVWAAGMGVTVSGLLWAVIALYRLPTTRIAGKLHSSPSITAPITAGWWSSRIIVPPDFMQWPCEQQQAALAHERAHISRHDWLVHMAMWLLSCVFWFHPLVRIARRRLSLLAECAADDAVLNEGFDAARYAEQLLQLGQGPPAAALALTASPVGVRIRSILQSRSRGGTSPVLLLATAALFCASSIAVGYVRFWDPPEPVFGCLPESPSWIAPWEYSAGSR